MKISNLRQERDADRVRAAATITWEDCDRGTQEVYFETGSQFEDGLTSDPHAFLISSLLPAMRHGEQRIAVEGDVCPQLLIGLASGMELIQFWYGHPRPLKIEAGRQLAPRTEPAAKRAAFFFTGGVDSLATLRVNRQHFAAQHPGYFRDGLLIFGLEVDRLDAFQHVLDVLSLLAEESGITMIPIYTNVRSLDDDWVFWTDQFEAAVLASAAHALNRRVSSASIGSSYDYPWLHPHGSHPLLDPHYSTTDLQIRHDGVALSRLAKTRLLAEWDAGVKSLRVCNRSESYRPGLLNCGTCEKCLRTLTALLVLDKLDKADSFANREVTPELVRQCVEVTQMNHPFWAELVAPLHAKGLSDLAGAISGAIRHYETNGGWKGAIWRFDSKHLGGSILRARQNLWRRVAGGALMCLAWPGSEFASVACLFA